MICRTEMIKIPGMFMVGAADRKCGKTEFACSVTEKFSSRDKIVGIKVTTIDKANGECPRGGAGCGVCSSLKGYYDISEETNGQANKDTCRMLASGAKRVFWLRVLKTHLGQGIAAMLDTIGDNVVSVCESNSLRRVVQPGLFVMVNGCGDEKSKASARDVAQYADRIVAFDGNQFGTDLDDIGLSAGAWWHRMKATAIIMAGGGSTRMGQDKSMLPIKGQPMIEHIYNQLRPHFAQVLISGNDVCKYGFLGAEVIVDRTKGRGPLMGIASALKASANDVNFVTACDIPEIDIAFVRAMIRQLRDNDVVVPMTGPSRYEPLFAVYKKGLLATIEDSLAAGKNRIIDALGCCKVKHVDLRGAQWLTNLNSMSDYREFMKKGNYVTV
jgi:molybdopterin-guanine dinucleotide biosynthesis protein A